MRILSASGVLHEVHACFPNAAGDRMSSGMAISALGLTSR